MSPEAPPFAKATDGGPTFAEATVDGQTLRAFLTRVARRVRGIAVLRGVTVAFAVAAVLVLTRVVAVDSVWRAAIIAIAAAVAGIAIGAFAGRRSPRRLATLVEHRVPASKNLVLTATEVIDHPSAVKPYIGDRISRDAAAFVARVDLRRAFPARREQIGAAAAGLLWLIAVVTATSTSRAGDATPRPSSETAAAISGIEIVVTPPPYTGLAGAHAARSGARRRAAGQSAARRGHRRRPVRLARNRVRDARARLDGRATLRRARRRRRGRIPRDRTGVGGRRARNPTADRARRDAGPAAAAESRRARPRSAAAQHARDARSRRGRDRRSRAVRAVRQVHEGLRLGRELHVHDRRSRARRHADDRRARGRDAARSRSRR